MLFIIISVDNLTESCKYSYLILALKNAIFGCICVCKGGVITPF